jgi:hypothetical protein
MEGMIDVNLAEHEPQASYPVLKKDFFDSFFAGYLIKNRYDEERLLISDKYPTSRFSFATNNGKYNLYGVLKQASPNHKLIFNLNSRNTITIGEYSNILNMCGLSCLTSFLHFSPGLYPIDSIFMEHFFPEIDDSFNEVKKNIPTFQRVGSIYIFALINHHKK